MKRIYGGFSLIELSIVLIIIGLLVAGVTGGQSLINSARTRSIMNELQSTKRMVLSFKVAKDRMPGDLNGDGYFGYCYGNCPSIPGVTEGAEPKHTTFDGEYSGKIVGVQAGPWVDLYNAGISEFKPAIGGNLETSLWRVGNDLSKKEGIQNNVPLVRGTGSTYFNMFETFSDWSEGTGYQENMKNGLFIDLYSPPSELKPKDLANLDSKVDDGTWNTGILRSCCGGGSSCNKIAYTDGDVNTLIENKCQEFYYRIME